MEGLVKGTRTLWDDRYTHSQDYDGFMNCGGCLDEHIHKLIKLYTLEVPFMPIIPQQSWFFK